MRVIRHVAHAGPAARPRVVAAGAFDGLHRGHQRLLASVIERAAALRGESVAVVARRRDAQPRVADLRLQLQGFRTAGIELVVFAGADELAAVIDRLTPALRVTAVGDDSAVSAGGALEQIAAVEHGGVPVTTDAVRAALARGALEAARAMLGRDPGVGGRVVHGFHRGGPLGIPTANLRVRGIQLPPDGVYAVRARLAGAVRNGVANIGFNPTFGNETRSVETHLLDFSGDLYGCRLEIAFVSRLRGEQKFSDVSALVAQIRADIDAARRFFAEHDA
jgi:riboflavin kinase/FMN adenylyltransferase